MGLYHTLRFQRFDTAPSGLSKGTVVNTMNDALMLGCRWVQKNSCCCLFRLSLCN
jgi:hypothetical protein